MTHPKSSLDLLYYQSAFIMTPFHLLPSSVVLNWLTVVVRLQFGKLVFFLIMILFFTCLPTLYCSRNLYKTLIDINHILLQLINHFILGKVCKGDILYKIIVYIHEWAHFKTQWMKFFKYSWKQFSICVQKKRLQTL